MVGATDEGHHTDIYLKNTDRTCGISGGTTMIDEKKVIKKLQYRINDFVLKHSDKKDCESVQVVKEFIHLLEEEAVYAEQQEIETFGKE